MKYPLTFIVFILFLISSLSAQFQFNVQGDAKIFGQLDISSTGSNLFIGLDTGEFTTTGTANTFIGLAAGAFNTEGASNTFIGLLSGFSNTKGKDNTFLGYRAGLTNNTGSYNTFLGYDAGKDSNGPNSHSNTFIGNSAGLTNTTGSENTFVGASAGVKNTEGYLNTFIGRISGPKNTSGKFNTFLGYSTGLQNTSGEANTFIGMNTGFNNTTGFHNTYIGNNAGSFNDKNENCTLLGYDADQSVQADFTNAMALGYRSRITASNTVVIGNSAIASIKGQVSFTTFSDRRFKNNIREDIPGIDFIRQLRPISYQVDEQNIAVFLGEEIKEIGPITKQNNHSKKKQSDHLGRDNKSLIRYSGFLAQEVEAVADKMGFDFSGVDKPENENSLYGLRYSEFVVPLVKGMQEQQELIEAQQEKIESQQTAIINLQAEMDDIKSQIAHILLKNENSSNNIGNQ